MPRVRFGSLAGNGAVLPVLPPRFALFELGVFALVIVLERFWEPFPDLSRMNPHPYWIAVLLLSLQYGTVSGLLAALLAIAGSVLIGLAEPEIGESYFAHLVRAWTQPVLWLLMALLLGSFRMRQIEARDDLQREAEELQTRSLALVEHVGHLKQRCETLERQLAARTTTDAQRLLDAMVRLEDDDATQRRDAFDATMQAAFAGCQASLFAVRDARLELVCHSRWPAGTRRREVWPAGDALVDAIVIETRAVSILSARDEAVLGGEGLIAVPVRGAEGRAVGMLKLEACAPQLLNATTARRLEVVAQRFVPLLTPVEARTPHEAAPPRNVITELKRLRWRRNEAEADVAGADPVRDRQTVR
jgi:hypothetical protein